MNKNNPQIACMIFANCLYLQCIPNKEERCKYSEKNNKTFIT